MHRDELPLSKKKSIFFTLLYWEHLLLHHNLDMMHSEKNICDNVVFTLLNQKSKIKDNLQACLDLQEMGLRSELHLRSHPGNTDLNFMPETCY